ncbi:RpiB/LacA/LacB family sugar-phosphate isomerase [Streptomyces sp. NPDC102274]|uniref:RpiB/LacA/LacB family sugar-phosphate isomerase n=1 Tax=Streptomyces sp. NPDC102274 TaxID=3366151 RepID=UPI00380F042F
MHIVIAADHNGVVLKGHLAVWLAARGHTVDDRGAYGDAEELVDYPPLCADVCWQVTDGPADRGIVLGGSGLGETIACNKFPGVRAGLCHDLWSTRISRGNNDSNVLVLAAKVVTPGAAEEIVAAWLDTPFKGGVHRRRLDQIAAIERGGGARALRDSGPR